MIVTYLDHLHGCRNQQRKYAQSHTLSYTLTGEPHVKPPLFPATFGDGIHYAEPTDSYLTVIPTSGRAKRTGSSGRHHQHDRNCVRFEGRKITRKSRITPLDNSATSLHSSGKDSGIVDSAVDVTGRCQCGHSSTHTSEESSA